MGRNHWIVRAGAVLKIATALDLPACFPKISRKLPAHFICYEFCSLRLYFAVGPKGHATAFACCLALVGDGIVSEAEFGWIGAAFGTGKLNADFV
jgi:hypothetical protein